MNTFLHPDVLCRIKYNYTTFKMKVTHFLANFYMKVKPLWKFASQILAYCIVHIPHYSLTLAFNFTFLHSLKIHHIYLICKNDYLGNTLSCELDEKIILLPYPVDLNFFVQIQQNRYKVLISELQM